MQLGREGRLQSTGCGYPGWGDPFRPWDRAQLYLLFIGVEGTRDGYFGQLMENK